MRYLFLAILLIFFTACQYLEEPPPPTMGAMKKLVLMSTVRSLKKEKELYACGWGGQCKSKIQMMALSFFYHKPVNSIEEGRDLLLYAVRRFVHEINKETRLHEYLDKCPFPTESVEIRIFIQKPGGLPISSESFVVLAFQDGMLEYDVHNSEGFLTTIYRETYEQALAQWSQDKNALQPTLSTEIQEQHKF